MKLRAYLAGAAAALCASFVWAQGLIGVIGGGEYSPPAGVGAVVSVNPTTGALTVLGTPFPGVGLTGVAMNSVGDVYAISASTASATTGPRLLRINPTTGTLIADVGRLRTAAGDDCYIGDLSFQPVTDVLYGLLGNQGPQPRCGIVPATSTGGYLVTINTSTAIVTVIGRDPSFGNSNGGIAFAPNGTLYFTPCWSDPGNIHTLNPATAAVLTTVPLVPGGTCYMGLAVRPSDGAIFASFDAENTDFNIYTLNPATGTRTLVGSPGTDNIVHDMVFVGPAAPPAAIAPVPMLSQWALIALALVLGGLGVAAARRRVRS